MKTCNLYKYDEYINYLIEYIIKLQHKYINVKLNLILYKFLFLMFTVLYVFL